MPLLMSAIDTQLTTMAAGAGKLAAPTTLLEKALDINADSMSQLLESLPQKAGAGSIFDAKV